MPLYWVIVDAVAVTNSRAGKLHNCNIDSMSPGKKFLLGILIAAAVASALYVRHLRRATIQVIGAVIMQNDYPRKELPIAGVDITASD